ncbi:hypothetical protein PFISCL1PPCAC_13441, partial [Pristionchus fissidentatus]
PRHSKFRPFWIFLSFLFFIAADVSTCVKYALFRGHNARANESSPEPLLDKLYSLEPFTSVWAAMVTAAALAIYGVLHGILIDTVADFNSDLSSASTSSTLSNLLDSFTVRHQSVLVLTRLLSSKMALYATVSGVLWLVIGIGALYTIVFLPAAVQSKVRLIMVQWQNRVYCRSNIENRQFTNPLQLIKTSEILVEDKTIWKGEVEVAQRAQIMLTMRRNTSTEVTIGHCLKLTPWVAGGV